MELAATRNFLLPRLDAVGRYRWRGFGNALLNPSRDGKSRFDNAYMDLTTGDFQEWQLGFELSFPFGQRQAHSALRNAQLSLARERTILDEQERQVIHDLSNAWADCRRAYEICQTAFNRRVAARTQLAILQEREKPGFKVDVNTMLDAQSRAADADSRYFRSLVEYIVAVKNVHHEKGTLLEYDNIQLAERVWPQGASAPASAVPPEPVSEQAPAPFPQAEESLPPPLDEQVFVPAEPIDLPPPPVEQVFVPAEPIDLPPPPVDR
jgi:outer membrane protein TolC